MISIYATHDNRGCISNELFPLKGLIEQNKKRFCIYTKDNAFIVSENAFDELLNGKPIPGYPLLLISEQLYLKYAKQGEKYTEHNGCMIFINYQEAISIARNKFANATILGDGQMMKQAINMRTVHRIFRVSIPGHYPGTIIFPDPMQEMYFEEVTPPEPWETAYGTATLQIYFRKAV